VVLASRGELPLILQRPIRGPCGQAVVTLLTPAGALLDGDSVDLHVECDSMTDVTLTTAAATKLNRCDARVIQFRLRASVSPGATLRYLPHALIPFTGARYQQEIEVDLQESACLTLLEVIGSGASASPFTFDRLDFATSVRVAGEPVVRGRFVLTPRSAAQLGSQTHFGSLLVFGEAAVPDVTDAPFTFVGVSDLPYPGRVVKMLGTSAQVVRSRLLGALADAGWLLPLLPP